MGIIGAGILSIEQIEGFKDENPNNIHELTIAPNTELEAKVTVTNHAVIVGGSKFTVQLYKKNDEGQFASTGEAHSGSSGGLAGIANTLTFDLGTLKEGEYIVLLGTEAGLTLGNFVKFNLIDQVLHHYSVAVVEGNLATVDGQAFNGEGKITKIDDDNVNAEDTVITGVHGKLTIKQDGNYSYKPNENAVSGSTETFEYTLTDSTGEKTVTGTLTITIQ